MTVGSETSARLSELQLGFERARDGVWVERIGAGLAYRRALRGIDEGVESSRRARDAAVLEAVQGGGSYREVARALGLSHSRVQQIVNSAHSAAAGPAELP